MCFPPCYSSYNSSYSARCSQSVGKSFVVPKFHEPTHKSVKHCGFSLIFYASTIRNTVPISCMHLALLPLSERSFNPTTTPRHTHLYLSLAFFMVLDPFSVLTLDQFVLLHLQSPLNRGEAKHYKSLVRIRI